MKKNTKFDLGRIKILVTVHITLQISTKFLLNQGSIFSYILSSQFITLFQVLGQQAIITLVQKS